jgi:DNA invertase Pin-like site-specific DNA recombinase
MSRKSAPQGDHGPARPDCRARLPRRGDTFVVWKLGRYVKDVLITADDLHALGIGVRILTDRFSGSYPPTGDGKFFLTMMAVFAGLERNTIHERTMASLAAAWAQGRTGKRPTADGPGHADRRPSAPGRGESPTWIA